MASDCIETGILTGSEFPVSAVDRNTSDENIIDDCINLDHSDTHNGQKTCDFLPLNALFTLHFSDMNFLRQFHMEKWQF